MHSYHRAHSGYTGLAGVAATRHPWSNSRATGLGFDENNVLRNYTQSPHTTLMRCVRIFTNLRDRREALSGVENTRSQVIFRENLP